MRKIDKRIVIILSLLFILVLGYGIMKYLISLKKPPPVRHTSETTRFVEAAIVKYSTITSPTSESGRLYSMEQVDIIAEGAGKIEPGNVALKKGTNFSKGDVLFVIYPDEAELALKAQKSQFLNSLANLLPDIDVDYPSFSNKFQNFFSSIDLEKDLPPFPEIDDEKLKIFLASRNILSSYYNILQSELQLKRRTKIAPFDGTFTDVYLEVGSYANTGGRVAHAIRTDILEQEVALDRFDANWVKVGDEVTLKPDGQHNEWRGKVVRKNQFKDENTQRQSVFIRVNNNKKNSLLVGDWLTAYFPGQPVENAMEVPRNAVFNTNEIFVFDEGRLKKETINIIKHNKNTLLINGLAVGDTVVTQPLINVLEGTVIEMIGSQPRKPKGDMEGKRPGENGQGRNQ